MEQSYLLKEGLVLMVVGMTIVYAFLSLMIGVMSFSRFYQRFSYLLPDEEPQGARADAQGSSDEDGARVALAIAIAKTRPVRKTS